MGVSMLLRAVNFPILLGSVFFLSANLFADVVFRDTFTAQNGTILNGRTPEVGKAWEDNSGLTIQSGAVDTSGAYNSTSAYGFFADGLTLSSVQTLQLSFDTLTPTNQNFFASGRWAGISLFSGSDEKFIIGKISSLTGWGIGDYSTNTTGLVPGIGTAPADAAQSVQFTYAYDTGAWILTVGGSSISGFAHTGLAIDRVRIGSDGYNYADIAVTKIEADITSLPEPATSAAVFSGLLLFALTRARQRRLRQAPRG
jgi:hypothetical protein